MRSKAVWTAAAAAVIAMIFGGWQEAPAETFTITVENVSPNVLSPVPFIAHDAGFPLFVSGDPASAAIENVAETGNPAGVVAMATAALGTTVSDFAVAGGAPLHNGESATVRLDTTVAHRGLSFASMMGVSNDGFIGRSASNGAIDLFPGGTPLSAVILIEPDEVWDAGTEVNDELATSVGALGAGPLDGTPEGGVITVPHPGIVGDWDIPASRDWTGGTVARITIVPEPATLGLLALGGLALLRRRRM